MKQICFISIKKSIEKFERLLNSINNLIVPEGYSINFLETESEDGVAAAYEEARKVSEADINIYIDGEAEIVNPNMLSELLAIFDQDDQIAVVGVLGTTYIPTSGIIEDTWKTCGSILNSRGEVEKGLKSDELCMDVKAIESFFMAVRGEIEWKTSLFKGEVFCCTAMCVDYSKELKRVVVTNTENAWIRYARFYKSYSEEEKTNFMDKYSKDVYPLVSILIPTYQRPNYFELALKSVINQTYRNLDIFVTDNSKDDRTKRLMERYLDQDPRITYEYHPEINTARENWDKAFEHYENNENIEYINWLMDDDLFAAEKIEKMVDFYLRYEDVALVTSARQRIDEEGNFLVDDGVTAPCVQETSKISGKEMGRELLRRGNIVGEPTTVLLKKDLLKGIRRGWTGKEDKKFQVTDYPTWLRLLEQGDVVYIREPLSYFRIHEGQGQRSPKSMAILNIALAYYIQYAIKNHVYLVDRDSIRQAYVNWIYSVHNILSIYVCRPDMLDKDDKKEMSKIVNILCNMSMFIAGKGDADFEVS